MNNFFQRLKNKFVAGVLTIASALGIQYARPPVLEHSPPPIEIQLPSPTPIPNGPTSGEITFPDYGKSKISLGKISATQYQIDSIINPGHKLAEHVWESDCFSDKIFDGNFTETNGLNNPQIVTLVKTTSPNVGVVFFYGSYMQNYVWKTMGFDDGSGIVYANSFYVDTPNIFGSLELHEIAHGSLGFHHYETKSTSIPYKFNDFFDECVNN